MKNMFRITFQLLGKYSDTAPSNIFVRCDTIEQASEYGERMFKNKLIDNGCSDAEFDMTVYNSSEEEAETYAFYMANRCLTTRSVN